MKKVLAMVLCFALTLGLVTSALGEDFTFRNGIKFGDSKTDVKSAMKSDKNMRKLVASDFQGSLTLGKKIVQLDDALYIGSLLGVCPEENKYFVETYEPGDGYIDDRPDGVALKFYFSDTGELDEIRYIYFGFMKADMLWDSIIEEFTKKYGEPTDTFNIYQEGGSTSIYGDKNTLAYATRLNATPDDRYITNEWLLRYDDYAVKIEVVERKPGYGGADIFLGQQYVSYRYLSNDDLLEYQKNAEKNQSKFESKYDGEL